MELNLLIFSSLKRLKNLKKNPFTSFQNKVMNENALKIKVILEKISFLCIFKRKFHLIYFCLFNNIKNALF